jgi:hypothetical protein
LNIFSAYRPFQKYFRARRMREFERIFSIRDETSIIDVGGTPFNWSFLQSRPRVTLANITEATASGGRFTRVVYDGKVVPFADNSFELCYSNSVIEHVGDAAQTAQFAREIRRLAPSYYVQTPNKWFFIEPHYMCAFLHWLPRSIKRRLLRRVTPWGWIAKPTQAYIDYSLDNIRLLSVGDMRALFPDAIIHRERFLRMTKSIIAIRQA